MDIKERFRYIYEILTMSLTQYSLLENIYTNYEPDSRTKELELVIIDALASSIIINISKITRESDYNKITILNFVNEYNKNHSSKMIGKEYPKPICEINRIAEYRNNIIAHSNTSIFSDDLKIKYKLMFSDFERVLNYIHEVLFLTSPDINGYSIGGRDTKTGKIFNLVTRNVHAQYNMCHDKKYRYKLMFDFLREHHKEELFNILNQPNPNYSEEQQ